MKKLASLITLTLCLSAAAADLTLKVGEGWDYAASQHNAKATNTVESVVPIVIGTNLVTQTNAIIVGQIGVNTNTGAPIYLYQTTLTTNAVPVIVAQTNYAKPLTTQEFAYRYLKEMSDQFMTQSNAEYLANVVEKFKRADDATKAKILPLLNAIPIPK